MATQNSRGGWDITEPPAAGRSVSFKGYRPNPPAGYAEKGTTNSGETPDYEGYIFSDGMVAVRWLTTFRSVSIWTCWDDFWNVHGHPEYETNVIFGKPEEPRFMTETKVDTYLSGYGVDGVRATHLPTGHISEGKTRSEAVENLGNWLSEKHPCYFKPEAPIAPEPVDKTTNPNTEPRTWQY